MPRFMSALKNAFAPAHTSRRAAAFDFFGAKAASLTYDFGKMSKIFVRKGNFGRRKSLLRTEHRRRPLVAAQLAVHVVQNIDSDKPQQAAHRGKIHRPDFAQIFAHRQKFPKLLVVKLCAESRSHPAARVHGACSSKTQKYFFHAHFDSLTDKLSHAVGSTRKRGRARRQTQPHRLSHFHHRGFFKNAEIAV